VAEYVPAWVIVGCFLIRSNSRLLKARISSGLPSVGQTESVGQSAQIDPFATSMKVRFLEFDLSVVGVTNDPSTAAAGHADGTMRGTHQSTSSP
jgi:hypothetical protein